MTQAPETTSQTVAWRRHLHRHPELSFQEVETSRFVEETLRSFGGLEISRPTPTSVVARLLCGDGPTLALRADIDALPILEESGVEFASEVPGVMHACGHDAHTAVLLTVAQTLVERRDELSGEVRFVFQHAEELPPGGAQELVAAGVLDGVQAMVGVHVISTIESGRVVVRTGPFMAAADVFGVRVRGRGGHAAMPHETIDPIACAVELVGAYNRIVPREIDPQHPAVLAVTRIHGGSADNITPEVVELRGTVRTFSAEDRETIRRTMERVAEGVAAAHGCSAELQYVEGYAAVVNDANVAELVRANVDPERLLEHGPVMGGEDFSAYGGVVPACFVFVGAGGKGTFPHHHPKFAIDEDALPVAAELFVRVALDYLRA